MTSVYGYVFLYLVIIASATATSYNTVYKHNITCGEVSQASCNLTKILKELNNDTHVSLTSGKYYLRNNIELANIHHVLISGASRNSVFIECSGDDIGISFVRSNSIRIKGLTISKCGAPHIGTSLYNFTFLAALHFVYCRDIEFYDVSVSYNSALGVNLYDVGGKVNFVASEFTSNKVVPGKDMLLPIVPARWAGGGIYVQFTYCGSMYGNGCTDNDDIEHQKYIHHNNYIFQDCIFSRNYASEPPQLPDTKNTDFLPPQKTDHMSLGRGGGLSLYLRGNASHNSFLVDNCSFIDNYAIWGGGFFTEIVDSCFQNEVVITKSLFTGNKAKWAGGGMRYGLIQVFSNMQPYNNGTFMNITFEQNSAIWGGATSVYATEEVLTKDRRASSQIHFSGVTWINNTASNGAAVGGASWKILSAGGVVVPVFKDTVFKNNHIFDYRSENLDISSNFSYSVISGQGTICTNAMPFYFEGKNQFLDNFGTVFLMIDAVLTAAAGTMEFIRNQGHDGGGISLLGQSWININPGSNFLFSKVSNILILQFQGLSTKNKTLGILKQFYCSFICIPHLNTINCYH